MSNVKLYGSIEGPRFWVFEATDGRLYIKDNYHPNEPFDNLLSTKSAKSANAACDQLNKKAKQ